MEGVELRQMVEQSGKQPTVDRRAAAAPTSVSIHSCEQVNSIESNYKCGAAVMTLSRW